jgi:hypothetical protein
MNKKVRRTGQEISDVTEKTIIVGENGHKKIDFIKKPQED